MELSQCGTLTTFPADLLCIMCDFRGSATARGWLCWLLALLRSLDALVARDACRQSSGLEAALDHSANLLGFRPLAFTQVVFAALCGHRLDLQVAWGWVWEIHAGLTGKCISGSPFGQQVTQKGSDDGRWCKRRS